MTETAEILWAIFCRGQKGTRYFRDVTSLLRYITPLGSLGQHGLGAKGYYVLGQSWVTGKEV